MNAKIFIIYNTANRKCFKQIHNIIICLGRVFFVAFFLENKYIIGENYGWLSLTEINDFLLIRLFVLDIWLAGKIRELRPKY